MSAAGFLVVAGAILGLFAGAAVVSDRLCPHPDRPHRKPSMGTVFDIVCGLFFLAIVGVVVAGWIASAP